MKTAIHGLKFFSATSLILIFTFSAHANIIESAKGGPWSDPETWVGGILPSSGDAVRIKRGHTIRYDIDSSQVLSSILVNGTLDFETQTDTRLEVGLIVVTPNESFDMQDACSGVGHPSAYSQNSRLQVGTPSQPIDANATALIRLHPQSAFDSTCAPAIVSHAGNLDFHGAPIEQTWVKLGATVQPGTDVIQLDQPVNWKIGDHILVTGTFSPPPRLASNTISNGGLAPESEEKIIVNISWDNKTLTVNEGFEFSHLGWVDSEEIHRGEVANLSRNVVVESADPNGIRGHTMYHKESGGVSVMQNFVIWGNKEFLADILYIFIWFKIRCGVAMC